jgi:hypothetical protein
MTPEAAKMYKPRRTPGSLDDVIYPETRAKMQAAKQEAADQKMDTANEAAYNKAAGMKKGGMAKFEKSGKDVEPKGMKEGSKKEEAYDRAQMMGMKKGGSASSRADGIAQRGKTRGTIVMCGGGMYKGK